jgi:carbon-monoxide dehydrogenase medium subunit
MIPASFDYVRADSLPSALDALKARDTKAIAGGQSLIPLLRFRLARPTRLVDIGRVPALRGIEQTNGTVNIGAATTYRDILDSTLLRTACPLLGEVAVRVGDVQVRNRATIGGGLAHADPASDMPATMIALGATFTLQSAGATRDVAASRFFNGPFATAIQPGELLTNIRIPVSSRGAGGAYVNFEQLASGYSLVGAAAVITMTSGTIASVTLAFAGISDTPTIASAAARLVGKEGDTATFASVANEAVASIASVNEDIHASQAYRRHLGTIAARRALTLAHQRAL